MRESKILQQVPPSIAASSKRTTMSPRMAGTDWFFNMSKTVGNQALQRYLISGFSKTPRQGTVIQRAIGVELEVPDWEVRTPKGKPFKKYAPLVRDDENGFTLSSDEYVMPTENSSNLEFVSDAHADKDDFLRSVGSMDKLARHLEQQHQENPIVLSDLLKRAGESETTSPYKLKNKAHITPRKNLLPSVQVTMGIPLGKMTSLFYKLANRQKKQEISGNEDSMENLETSSNKAPTKKLDISSYEDPVGKLLARFELMKSTFQERRTELGFSVEEKMSPQLEGLSAMIAYYLRSSFVPMGLPRNQKRQFPKGLFPVLAKTPFHRMFELIPDHELQAIRDMNGQMKPAWVEWFLDGALGEYVTKVKGDEDREKVREDIFNGPMLPQKFGEPGEEAYRIDLKRSDWLRNMPTDDLLTERNNPKLKGMGVFSGKGDVLAEESADNTEELEKYAPVFELRGINGSPKTGTWESWAEDCWSFYEELVGQGVRYKTPTLNKQKERCILQ
ncbi:hypothetical protein [Paenibacillus oleatilyticus]|uniref:hypothetical protein n=1 Tax=Paenibacillus oleatilyticus TaxID=2594886 RepID=UPI001C1F2E6C|nr:hypothetical protein [Paenibacillus oleatilyticus]MBU7317177.1 hypothetical protein [Paenibacillus oleatilyticus]